MNAGRPTALTARTATSPVPSIPSVAPPGLAYDLTRRVTKQTFPDEREVLFGYDANGKLTPLTPPGRPDHRFTHTPVDPQDL